MNKRKSRGAGGTVLGIAVLFLVIGAFVKQSEPKCSVVGCDEERYSDSRYCVVHDLNNWFYGEPDYNAVYRRSQRRVQQLEAEENARKSAVADDSLGGEATAYKSKVETGKSARSNYPHTSKSTSPKSSVTRRYDVYDVYDYDDGDDFAEEWAEEFGDGDYEEGYDDAYAYWKKKNEEN
jgi:hypothetical protein